MATKIKNVNTIFGGKPNADMGFIASFDLADGTTADYDGSAILYRQDKPTAAQFAAMTDDQQKLWRTELTYPAQVNGGKFIAHLTALASEFSASQKELTDARNASDKTDAESKATPTDAKLKKAAEQAADASDKATVKAANAQMRIRLQVNTLVTVLLADCSNGRALRGLVWNVIAPLSDADMAKHFRETFLAQDAARGAYQKTNAAKVTNANAF